MRTFIKTIENEVLRQKELYDEELNSTEVGMLLALVQNFKTYAWCR